jgi:hypothetical protein
MATITSDQFREICAGVWRDRSSLFAGKGFLSCEAALMRAVYWRLCKGGVRTASPENYGSAQTCQTYQTVVGCVIELNARPPFDGEPFLKELLTRYENEEKSHLADEGATHKQH